MSTAKHDSPMLPDEGSEKPRPATNAVDPNVSAKRFFNKLAGIVNAGQSRSIILAGEVHDLFFSPTADSTGSYVPLVDYICDRCRMDGLTILVYEQNGPVRLQSTMGANKGWDMLRQGWVSWKAGVDHDTLVLQALTDKNRASERQHWEQDFDRNLREVVGRPTFALEFLRQLTLCSRSTDASGKSFIRDNLLIVIEAADLALPAGNGDIANLGSPDRHRIGIAQDWFSDPGFTNGDDTVLLLSESVGLVHPRVSKLPSVLSVDVGAPDYDNRKHYIDWFMRQPKAATGSGHSVELWGSIDDLARFSAGLSIHALRQMLIASAHSGRPLRQQDVIAKVESFIQTQLGEDVVAFKKPEHSLDNVIGFTQLKNFVRDELLPRFRSTGADALPGAAVAGPIGGGKTFIFEAVAAALDLPVLELKNIRSQWFGQTDVIFEKLRRVLQALDKVVIFVDEADTQFGGVGPDAHATERRLTGKVQQMMSDPALRGHVIWLLMTARIHLLSPDIRRPGRVGDLIIPVLDPEDEDRAAFIRWVLSSVLKETLNDGQIKRIDELTQGYSAAAFASLRSNLKARSISKPLAFDDISAVIHDQLPPDIASTRRYQTLQAMINCTRRSLLPDPDVTDEQRDAWSREVRELEARGIS